MTTMLLFIFSIIALVPVYWIGSFTGVAIYLSCIGIVYNLLFRSFMRALPRTSRQVPPQPIAYCQQLSAQALSKHYREGTLTCAEVVETYIRHIQRVNPYINAMVFECFDEARQNAQRADAIWAAWRVNKIPHEMPSWLLGVPCTIKECMECVGCPNSSGHPTRRNVICTMDSPVVHNFREAGAVILGVTNTSELCMWYESSNYNYGITCNPYDTRCLVGGSSGGEGAAAGAAFSTFSLGSDIGGSIRMPAFFNGVYGHKASPHYISNRGQHPGAKTSANHYMTTGPITRFPQDIIPLCEIAAKGGFREDPVEYPPCDPLHSVIDITQRPLRVFAIEDYGIPMVHVSESQVEAIHTAAETLRKYYNAEVTYVNVRYPEQSTNHTVPCEFLPFKDILSMWMSVLTNDPTETKFNELMSQGADKEINWLGELVRWACGKSFHTLPAIILCIIERMELYLPAWMKMSSSSQLHTFKRDIENLLGHDGIILAPTFPSPAPRHHAPLLNPMQFQYTAAFNVLQLPATACPIWSPSMLHRVKAASIQEERLRQLPHDYHLPKGVQVVSATHNDELSVSVAIALDSKLGGYRYPSWALLQGVHYNKAITE